MDIRESIGEVSGANIIDKGDNVEVTFFENGKEKTAQGILIDADETKIKINGSIPLKEIEIKNIKKIEKIS